MLGVGLASSGWADLRESSSPSFTGDSAAPTAAISVGWESHYASEGRDNLDGDSLWTTALDFGWKHLSAGLWFGKSYEQDYDEFHFNLALTKSFADVEVYLAYTRLEFPFEKAHDDEVGVGLHWAGLPLGIGLVADLYYAFEAEGYFAEFALVRAFELSDDLSTELAAVFGMNQGYVSDGHDGANHAALRFAVSYTLTDALSVSAHLAQSWGLNAEAVLPGDEALKDFAHGGMAVEWGF